VVKPGTRALGVAVSASGDTTAGDGGGGGERATVGGAVVRASRVADGFSFSACSVGGLDSTAAVTECYERLGREDVRYVLLAGVAPAWFNLVDLRGVHEAVDRPVLAVSFEESDGLRAPIEREFAGREREERLAVYESLPDRHPVAVNGERVFVRSVGCEDPDEVLRAFTPEGGRPEPLRVARLAARAADGYV
jgi:endonuclease V-like protein UPF0215 family